MLTVHGHRLFPRLTPPHLFGFILATLSVTCFRHWDEARCHNPVLPSLEESSSIRDNRAVWGDTLVLGWRHAMPIDIKDRRNMGIVSAMSAIDLQNPVLAKRLGSSPYNTCRFTPSSSGEGDGVLSEATGRYNTTCQDRILTQVW
jgi:hypothetical protein